MHVSEANTFEVELGTIHIPGEANPISELPIEVNVTLSGAVNRHDHLCGKAFGSVTVPIELPLDGSDWTMSYAPEPDTPPQPDWSCSE